MNSACITKYEELCNKYNSNLLSKINEIEAAFINLTNQWSAVNLDHVHTLIHKLSGSAGIFGNIEISEIAKVVEEQYLCKYDNNILPAKTEINEIASLIAKMKKVGSNGSKKVIFNTLNVGI
jgi:HPt (histidine-containing phosphotransfer) domain-containing protein